MKQKKLRFAVVTFSILLMTCSALISYNLIRKNDDQIMILQSDIKKKQEAINNIWQGSLNQQAKVDNTVLVSLISKDHKEDYSKIIKHYTKLNNDSVDSLVGLLIKAEKDRRQAINAIDDLYGEKIAAENEIMAKSQKNKLYTAITIFLQLLSVILVTVSRDLEI